MATDSFLISLPALIALTIKGGIFWYALSQPLQNLASRLFLYFLAALTIVNVVEISGFYILIDLDTIPVLNGYLYYVFVILALAFLFHLVSHLALPQAPGKLVRFVYGYAAGLAVLLLTTDWVVADFKRYAYAIVREPGPLYLLFELYALPIFAGVIGLLIYGGRKQRTAVQRLKNRWMLIAIVPMCVVIGGVVVLLHAGIKLPFNTNFVSPLAISYFLVVASYAIYQHRLFDLQFFLPWSKVRRRKTAFYDRIRALIAEVADLRSSDQIVDQLADCFACPVALVDGDASAASNTDAARQMMQLPKPLLNELKEITVTEEMRDAQPDLFASLDRFGIAAVVPFNSYQEDSNGWLLLGRSFSDNIYSQLDFHVVETLFAKLAEEFLDQQLASRTKVSNLKRSLSRAQLREQKLQQEVQQLKSREQEQQALIEKLQARLPIGSDAGVSNDEPDLAPRLMFLGKQKSLRSQLKQFFPQTQAFFSPASAGFREHPLPELMVCDVDGLSDRAREELLELVEEHRASMAVLLSGSQAAAFVQSHRSRLAGGIVERLPEPASAEYLRARVGALTGLVRTLQAIADVDYPIVAQSQANRVFLTSCRQTLLAGRILCMVSPDTRESLKLAHHCADKLGYYEVKTFPASEFVADSESTQADALKGKLAFISNIDLLDTGETEKLAGKCLALRSPVILTSDDENHCELPGLQTRHNRLPSLREREADVPFLIQYFTLQHNLATGDTGHLSQAAVDRLRRDTRDSSVEQLRLAVYEELEGGNGGEPGTALADEEMLTAGVTLDNYLAKKEFELLKQTLDKCGGNKAQTASLLGLKPNTLHYKLKRHGLLDYPN